MTDLFDAVAQSGRLEPIDLHFARLIHRLAGEPQRDLLALTAALVSRERGRGHSCVDLGEWAGRSFPEGEEPRIVLPERAGWQASLAASGLVASGGGAPAPLVLEGGRVYLGRYWHAEQRLARRLSERLQSAGREVDVDRLGPLFRRLFPSTGAAGVDWQAVAAAAALASSLVLISGGPGTGKTTTVTRILALLLAADRDLRVALAAPTGKAAARLGESIAGQRESLPVDDELRERIPSQASTLHRLLGYLPRNDRFRHHAERPLACDLLIIDEASMVDLLMMDAVLAALPATARVVLLGDRDQLASVETGFVFGDLCAAARDGAAAGSYSPAFAELYRELCGRTAGDPGLAVDPSAGALRDAAVELRTSYRFRVLPGRPDPGGLQPGIESLARAIRDQDADRVLELLAPGAPDDVERSPPPAEPAAALEPLGADLESVLAADSATEALVRLGRFRVLCATRRGPWGVEHLNALAEHRLVLAGHHAGEPFYRGRPILIAANDYQVRLFNGDLGVCWPQDGRFWAWFPDPAGGLRRLPLAKLPAHDTAWAITVHKSQGSEFDRVLLMLPATDAAVLCRELLYTGVTRARRQMHLVATEEIVRRTLARRGRRRSGLVEAILGREREPAAPPRAAEVAEVAAKKPAEKRGQLSLFD